MVSTDGKATILNYVRNCFASGDDSGFCERLIGKVENVTDEEIERILSGQYFNEVVNTESDYFYRHSPEYAFVPCEDPLNLFYSINNFENSQQSSLSHKKNASTVQQLSAEEIDKYFPSKPIVRTNKQSTTCGSENKSGLTLALEQAKLSGQLKRNKLFSDYAIYDARSTLNTNRSNSNNCFLDTNIDPSLRQFNVWLWRLNGFPRISIKVQPRLGTTVQQFMGLTLWQYFNEFSTSDSGDSTLTPSLLNNLDESFLNRLALHMFDTLDDNNECDNEEDVDSEFPPLELTDPIHKYQFQSFALVERVETPLEEVSKEEISRVLVTIHMAQGMSVLRFPSDTCLSTVLERAVHRRRLRQHGGYAYRLELWPRSTDQQNMTNIKGNNLMITQSVNKNCQLDLNKPLSYFIAAGLPLHFLLVRENSRYDTIFPDQNDDIESSKPLESTPLPLDTTLEPVRTALQLRQYQVTYLKGLFPSEIQLNISSNEVKLEQKRPKLFSKLMKSLIIQINAIADCELITSAAYSASSSTTTCGPPPPPPPSSMDKSLTMTTKQLSSTAAPLSTPSQLSSVEQQQQQQSSKSFLSRKTQFRIVYIPNFDTHSNWITSQLTTSGASGRSISTIGQQQQQQPHVLLQPTSTSTAATCLEQHSSEVNNTSMLSTGTTTMLNTSNTSTANITTTTTTTANTTIVNNSSNSSNNDNTNTTTTATTNTNHNGSLFQQLCFETQWARARAICDQLNIILEVCQSQSRQLYYLQQKSIR
ncbi:unnamed protein product [Schistosoma turkestanicum]|nr:unnamed protein product [Schistosoma turkestanicum]